MSRRTRVTRSSVSRRHASAACRITHGEQFICVYVYVCLRGVVSQCSVVAVGRGAGSSNSSSDGSVWRSPGIDPGTTASSSSPQRPTQPGPSTPRGFGRAATLAQPLSPARTAPVRAIALWSSSLSACTNKACIRSVRVCKGLKRACGAVEMEKNDFKGRSRGCCVPKKVRWESVRILSDSFTGLKRTLVE